MPTVRSKTLHLATVVIGCSLLIPGLALGAWSNDPAVGVPIATAEGAEATHVSIPDGSGGAFVAWAHDSGPPLILDIYVQHINNAGIAEWTENGVPVCTAEFFQNDPLLVADGAGGVFVTWRDQRNITDLDVYMQHVDATGVPQWTNDGMVVRATSASEIVGGLVPDSEGGAIIIWSDERNDAGDIYAQRINADGVSQWDTAGVSICAEVGKQSLWSMYGRSAISDGAGGLILAWMDTRNGNEDLYVQRVNDAGVQQWTPEGVALCTATGTQGAVAMVADGSGGAIIAWTDSRSGTSSHIYAQRVTSNGEFLWTPDGVAICTVPGENAFKRQSGIATDGAGGAFIMWAHRDPGLWVAFTQLVNADGVVQWTTNGVALGHLTQQHPYSLADDGAGGIIVAMTDERGNDDIYVQRFDSSADPQWGTYGAALAIGAISQTQPYIIMDGAHAIVAWTQPLETDLYCNRVDHNGNLAGTPDPERSIVPCLSVCPEGGFDFTVKIYDAAGDSVPGAEITMDFAACDSVQLCASGGTEPYDIDPGERSISATADTTGTFTFPLRAGGISYDSAVTISADGVLLAVRSVASCDQDGDLNVDAQDAALFDPKVVLGSPDPTADFDCDGYPGVSEATVFTAHLNAGHSCQSIIDVVHPGMKTEIVLHPIVPNPTTGEGILRFDLPAATIVSLKIFDTRGRLVRTGLNTVEMPGGHHHWIWNGRDHGGVRLPPGMYFISLETPLASQTRKVVVLE